MVIKINAEKFSEIFQCPFMISSLQKMNKEGNYLIIIKAISEKPRAKIILSGEKLKAYPLRSGKDKGAHSHHYQSALFGSPNYRRGEKERKGIQIGKEEAKLSLFAHRPYYTQKTQKKITRGNQ